MNPGRLISGMLVAAFAIALIACGSDTTIVVERNSQGDGTIPSEFVPADIESVDVVISDDFPAQYVAHVTVIQPNSCAIFAHVETRQEPDTPEIEISAVNEILGGPDASCDQAISTTVQDVPLGVDFEPDSTYTMTFTAAGPTPVFSFEGLQAALDKLDVTTVEADDSGELPTPVTGVLDESASVASDLDLLTCEGVLGAPPPNFTLEKRPFTDTATVSSPELKSMCIAVYEAVGGRGEALTAGL
jgi:hypothetical protein